MTGRRDLRGRLTSLFDLPGDVVLDVARIILIGDLELAVENHRGLVEYTPQRVVIAIPGGRLVVVGGGLTIGSITSEEITLTGRITGLERIGAE